MGRKIGKSAIEVMRERFPANASEIETYADAFDVLAEKVNTGGGGESVTVDAALSNSSKNPVQNKVVKAAIDAADNVIRVPFVLTVNQQTGETTATTTASFADTLAAFAAEKVVVADAVLTIGSETSHMCAVMSCADSATDANKIITAVALSVSATGPDEIAITANVLTWKASGVTLKGKTLQSA